MEFINDGKLRLNDIVLSANGSVNFLRSQFSKAEFNYVNLSTAKIFRIYLSNITEIITNNTTFSNNIQGRDELDYPGIREIYRQLKNAAGKQGDRFNELRYEELEMVTFSKILVKNNDSDKWILRLNYWSNRYGQDWIRASYLLLLFSFILYNIIRVCLGYWYFDSKKTFTDIASFIDFSLNPLHKFTDIFNNSNSVLWNGVAKSLDVVARLFSGFMIFQFLRAFRKYAR